MFHGKSDCCLVRRFYHLLAGIVVMAWPCIALAKDVPADDDLFPDEPAPQEQVQQGRFEIGPEQFDQWVFGGQFGNGERRSGEAKLSDLLEARCQSVQRVVHLSDSQVMKLKLAGHGDIHRFMQKVEVVRVKFDQVRHDQQRFNEIWQDIQPLQEQMNAGLFDGKSLFQKVLGAILDEQQANTLNQDEFERRKFGYEACIGRMIVQLEKSVPLTSRQREILIESLRDTPPPARFGPNDQYYVLWRLSEVPEEKLRPTFTALQWNLIQRQRQQGAQMKGFLEQSQFMPAAQEVPAADAQPAAIVAPAIVVPAAERKQQ